MMKKEKDRKRQKDWQEHIELQEHSGLTVAAYCQEFQLSKPSFYVWRKRLRKERDGKKGFIQIPSSLSPSKGLLWLEVPGGYTIKIERDVDEELLARTLRVLKAS